MSMANIKRNELQLGLEQAGIGSKIAQKKIDQVMKDANVDAKDIKTIKAAIEAKIDANIKQSALAPNELKKNKPDQDAAPAPTRRLGQ
jgi:phospholipase C